MMSIEDQFYIRQQDIISKLKLSSVSIIGCGASGSCIGVLLAKLGCPIIDIWDGDQVEPHNLPNQYYPENALGKNKAEALEQVILQFTPPDLKPLISVHKEYYTDEPISANIVFLCVDGLDNRREVYRKLQIQKDIQWIIDTRMGAEYYEVHTVNMDDSNDKRSYYDTLKGDGMPLPCTGRAVIYNVMSMSSIAISLYVKMVRQNERDYIPKKITCDLVSYTITREYREYDNPIIKI